MASQREHDGLGTMVGGLSALVSSLMSEQPTEPLDLLMEVLGGMASGRMTSRLPDVFEPPTSSWHRSTAHGLVATLGVSYLTATYAANGASKLRQAANHSATRARADTANAGVYTVERALARFAAGALIAAGPGYASHTLADAATPRGIPLLTRGF